MRVEDVQRARSYLKLVFNVYSCSLRLYFIGLSPVPLLPVSGCARYAPSLMHAHATTGRPSRPRTCTRPSTSRWRSGMGTGFSRLGRAQGTGRYSPTNSWASGASRTQKGLSIKPNLSSPQARAGSVSIFQQPRDFMDFFILAKWRLAIIAFLYRVFQQWLCVENPSNIGACSLGESDLFLDFFLRLNH